MLVAATVHFPYMTASPDDASASDREATLAGFAHLGRAFESAGIETIIAITSEHIVNLQPRMAPPFVLGVGEQHPAFAEPQFNLEPVTRRGNPEVASMLIRSLYNEGFDVAHSSELRLDHGTTLPLQLMNLAPNVTVVPLIINSIFAPMPTLERCRKLGIAIATAVAAAGLDKKVGLLATGGISHTVGAPGMEVNHPAFDTQFLQELVEGRIADACRYTDEELESYGNGTHEIRNWIVGAAASMGARPEIITSIPFASGWDSGVHQLLWNAS